MVDRREPRMIDLMFSCCVQGKGVEHAFLNHLLRVYKERGFAGFHATYRKTERNSAPSRVLEDMKFACLDIEEAKSALFFDVAQPIEVDGIIEIVIKE